ncbi:MAG: hypothetical protein IPH57_08540 [Saprospiraceae bacterium]|nr:hypothetical protein [Saprospiraceae bacterium]
MEESKRFLRYVIPGLIFIFQIGLVLEFTDVKIITDQETQDFYKIIITLFISSGLLGYLFSNLYFFVHWNIDFKKCFGIDYKQIVDKNKGFFKINESDVDNKNLKTDKTQLEYWIIINVFWNLSPVEGLEKIKQMTDKLSDMLHSLGTTILSMFLALLMGIIIIFHQNKICFCFCYFISICIILIFLICHYRKLFFQLLFLYEEAIREANTRDSKK